MICDVSRYLFNECYLVVICLIVFATYWKNPCFHYSSNQKKTELALGEMHYSEGKKKGVKIPFLLLVYTSTISAIGAFFLMDSIPFSQAFLEE